MRVSGFENIAGPIGNLAGINMSGFDINKRPGALGGRSGAQLKGIYEGGTQQNQQLNEELKNRGIMERGVKLPLVQGGPSPLGNAGFFEGQQFLAQSSPGGQNIGNVGGMMQPPQEFIPMEGFEGYGSPQPTGPSPDQLKALQTYDNAKQKKDAQNAALLRQGIESRNQMLEASPVSRKPVYLDINAVPQGLESIGAGARLDLGRNQDLNFGGTFTPGYTEQGVQIPQGYTLKAGYGTPSLDVNVNFREGRRGLGPQQGGGFGAEAMYNTRF